MFGRSSTDHLIDALDALDDLLASAWPQKPGVFDRRWLIEGAQRHSALVAELARRGVIVVPQFIQSEVARGRH